MNVTASDSSETLKANEDKSVKADPTLAPRRAYSMEVVGKWTQIVRQQNLDQNDEPKAARLVAKLIKEQKNKQAILDEEQEFNE